MCICCAAVQIFFRCRQFFLGHLDVVLILMCLTHSKSGFFPVSFFCQVDYSILQSLDIPLTMWNSLLVFSPFEHFNLNSCFQILPTTLSEKVICRVFALDHPDQDPELMSFLHMVFQSNSTKIRVLLTKSSVLGVLDFKMISH